MKNSITNEDVLRDRIYERRKTMFERLQNEFGKKRENMVRRRVAATDVAVKAMAKLAGIELRAKPAKASAELPDEQSTAFEAAVRVILETLTVGSARIAPNFGDLEGKVRSTLESAGWEKGDESLRQLAGACLATSRLIEKTGSVGIYNEETEKKQKAEHRKALEFILDRSGGTFEIQLKEMFLQHDACGDALIFVRWRDLGNRKFTDFDVHLFFGETFVPIGREVILMELIWKLFSSDYRSHSTSFGHLVSGSLHIDMRDGIGTKFIGQISSKENIERLSSFGLPIFPVQISARLNEQML